uniref:Pentatricopeptide repeat-containing protein n=1 Tax=Brassica oleracea TaxID=3712 RepID=A0A3P6GH42_BRAOL|nr:unnamed protein product [Brassica oleracea]
MKLPRTIPPLPFSPTPLRKNRNPKRETPRVSETETNPRRRDPDRNPRRTQTGSEVLQFPRPAQRIRPLDGVVLRLDPIEAFHALYDNIMYNSLINGHCKFGAAESFMAEMINKKLEPTVVTYTSLMSGYCSKGKHTQCS